MLRGIDVSSCQGVVNWPQLAAAGIRFAYAKCSTGNNGTDPIASLPGWEVNATRAGSVTGRDPQFAANVAGAKAAGIYVGPYHFAFALPLVVPGHNPDPTHNPDVQAKFAFDAAGGLGSIDGELPPALDLEWPYPHDWAKWGCSAAQIRRWALDCLGAMEGFWGCLPALYTFPDFWMHVGGPSEPAFARYPLWMASYPRGSSWPKDTDRPPILAKPWEDWTFWQWTGGDAKLPNGVPADFDCFNGDEAALARLCGSNVAPSETPTVPDLPNPGGAA